MKCVFFLFTLLSSATLIAQNSQSLPQTLPELAKSLPALIHHKQFQMGPFSDAVDAALRKDPESVASAIPALSEDLSDPDPNVQFNTLAVLSALATPQNAGLFAPVFPKLAKAISSDEQYSQGLAIYTVAEFGQKVPDSVVLEIEKLLVSRPSDRLTKSSAQALMITRPKDDTAQNDIISAINDPNRSVELRRQILIASSIQGVGSQIINNVVQIVNTSEDKNLRDAAIEAADQIGPSALAPFTTGSAKSRQILPSLLHRTGSFITP